MLVLKQCLMFFNSCHVMKSDTSSCKSNGFVNVATGDLLWCLILVPIFDVEIYICKKTSKRGGGVGIIFRNTFKCSVSQSFLFSTYEHMEVSLRCNSLLFHIVVIYRPPCSSISNFLLEFSQLLETINISTGRLIIIGDFNIHME